MATAKSSNTKATKPKTTKSIKSSAKKSAPSAKTPQKKGLSTGTIVAIVLGSVFGGLAIIGGCVALIFGSVFLATPAVERSARDTIREANILQIATEVLNYQTNNRGKLPTDWSSFQSSYISDIVDPDNAKYTLKPCDYSAGTCKDPSSLTFNAQKPIIYIATGATCDGNTLKSASSRKVAVYTALETGGAYCASN